MGGGHWTIEDVERLRELWTDGGMSASQIGNELGYGRNAVIGKAHREGLAGTKKKSPPREYKPRPHRRVAQPKRALRTEPRSLSVFFQHQKKPRIEPEQLRELPDMDAPKFLDLSLMQLKKHSCRFPRGGDDGTPYRFCGQPIAVQGVSYCPYHCEIAFAGPARSPAYAFTDPRFAEKR